MGDSHLVGIFACRCDPNRECEVSNLTHFLLDEGALSRLEFKTSWTRIWVPLPCIQAVLKEKQLCTIHGCLSGLPGIPEFWLCHLDWVGHGLAAIMPSKSHLRGLYIPTLHPFEPFELLVFIFSTAPQSHPSPPAHSPTEAFIPLGLFPTCSNPTAFLPVTTHSAKDVLEGS